MKRLSAKFPGILLVLCLGTLVVLSRPDYYTSEFYTRGTDAALYIDQGGIPSPVAVPLQDWNLLPRVTLEATRNDNYGLEEDGDEVTTVNLIPGALLIYGRPEHNHLYADAGLIVPLYENDDSVDRDPSYMITAGGVRQTGRSQIHGRLGYRRTESASVDVGERLVGDEFTGDLALERRVSDKSSLGLNGTVESHAYDGAGYIDYQRYYAAGRFYHRLNEKSEWFAQAGAGQDVLDEQKPGVYGDATFYDLSGGVRGRPSPKTTTFGRMGYRWRDYDDGAIDSVGGLVASIGSETTPMGLSTFSFELLSDIRPDITGAGDSTTDTRMILGVKRRLLSERLRGDASLLFGEVEYTGESGSTTDDYWGYRLALDYWSRWDVSLGLAYAYTERESEQRSDYENGLWTARASWNF